MLDAIFQILSVLGIILLSLMGIFLALLLLILFFPVSYRLTGTKSPSETWLRIRITWLFGIFRLRYQMPDPGNVTAKLLWFTVFDSSRKKQAKEHQSNEISSGEPQTKEAEKRKAAKKQPQEQLAKEKYPEQTQSAEELAGQQEHHAEEQAQEPEQQPEETASQGICDRIWEKIQKLKYTICNIYDKIKRIRENISYYMELLREHQRSVSLWKTASGADSEEPPSQENPCPHSFWYRRSRYYRICYGGIWNSFTVSGKKSVCDT